MLPGSWRMPAQPLIKGMWMEENASEQALTWRRYLDLTLRAMLSSDPSFRFCKATGCDSGQIHEAGEIFSCTECHHKHCVDCEVDWHSGVTCQAFQAEKTRNEQAAAQTAEARKRHEEEDAASKETIAQVTKACPGPGCGRQIEKRG